MQQTNQGNPEHGKSVRRAATASLVGTMVEWYDYFIFGTASALVFGKLFFPGLPGTGGILASFATFAVGFFFRPVGAAVFGHFGDRVGRKKLLIISLFLMGSGTFLIGALPTAAAIGAFAPILLVLMRILQGLGVSGEWGGAVLMSVEHAPERRRGFYGSFPQIGNALGLLLATGTFALLTLLPQQQFLSWGWRVPFLASSFLLAVGLYIRLRVFETPVFKEAQRRSQAEVRIPFLEIIKNYRRSVVLGIGLRWSNDVLGYYVMAFAISYMTNRLALPGTVGTLATAAAAFVCIFTAPFFGALSDRTGRKRVYAFGTVLILVLAFPFFWMIHTKSIALIILGFVLIYGFANFSQYAVQGSIFSELFPTRVRYSGTSITYHLTSVIGGGPAPLIATSLVAWAGGAFWPASVYLMAVAAVSLIALSLTRETYLSTLYEESPQEREASGAIGEPGRA